MESLSSRSTAVKIPSAYWSFKIPTDIGEKPPNKLANYLIKRVPLLINPSEQSFVDRVKAAALDGVIQTVFQELYSLYQNKTLSDYHFVKLLVHFPEKAKQHAKEFQEAFDIVQNELVQHLDDKKSIQRTYKLFLKIENSEAIQPLFSATKSLQIPFVATDMPGQSVSLNRYLLALESPVFRTALFGAWQTHSNATCPFNFSKKELDVLKQLTLSKIEVKDQKIQKIENVLQNLSVDELIECAQFADMYDIKHLSFQCLKALQIEFRTKKPDDEEMVSILENAIKNRTGTLRRACLNYWEASITEKTKSRFWLQWDEDADGVVASVHRFTKPVQEVLLLLQPYIKTLCIKNEQALRDLYKSAFSCNIKEIDLTALVNLSFIHLIELPKQFNSIEKLFLNEKFVQMFSISISTFQWPSIKTVFISIEDINQEKALLLERFKNAFTEVCVRCPNVDLVVVDLRKNKKEDSFWAQHTNDDKKTLIVAGTWEPSCHLTKLKEKEIVEQDAPEVDFRDLPYLKDEVFLEILKLGSHTVGSLRVRDNIKTDPQLSTAWPLFLTKMDLSNCEFLTDMSILQLPRICKKIQTLKLPKNYALDFKNYQKILGTLSDLKELQFSFPNENIDAFLTDFVKLSLSLNHLTIQSAFHLSQNGITHLLERWPDLKQLMLPDTNVSREILAALCPELEKVSLKDSRNKATSEMSQKIFDQVPTLKVLDFVMPNTSIKRFRSSGEVLRVIPKGTRIEKFPSEYKRSSEKEEVKRLKKVARTE